MVVAGLVIWVAVNSWPNNDARYGFRLTELGLNPIRTWLVTPTLYYDSIGPCQINSYYSLLDAQLAQ